MSEGVYLGGVIGGPTEHELTDPDGDGVYGVDVTMENGTTGNYIFLNEYPDWSCKENLQGLPVGSAVGMTASCLKSTVI